MGVVSLVRGLKQVAVYDMSDVASGRSWVPEYDRYMGERVRIHREVYGHERPWWNITGHVSCWFKKKMLGLMDKWLRVLHQKMTVASMTQPQQRADKRRFTLLKHTVLVGENQHTYALCGSLTAQDIKTLGCGKKIKKGSRHAVVVGEGSFGKVRMARDLKTGAWLAVKKVPLLMDPSKTQQFRHEKNMHALLRDCEPFAAVESIESYGHKSTRKGYVLMPYAQGDLFDVCQKTHEKIKKSSQKQKASLVQLLHGLQVCVLRALVRMHEHGVYHLDVKLENVLWDAQGLVGMTDFGLSTDHKTVRTSVGTEGYVAPDVLYAHNNLYRHGFDAASADAWSVGVVLYALHENRLPFHFLTLPSREQLLRCVENALNVAEDIPEGHWLKAVLRGLWASDPSKRMTVRAALELTEKAYVDMYGVFNPKNLGVLKMFS